MYLNKILNSHIKSFWLFLVFSYFMLFTLSACNIEPNIKKFQNPNSKLYGYKVKNKTIIFPKYIFAHNFTPEGLAVVMQKDGIWVRINQKEQIIEYPYLVNNAPDHYSEGLTRFISDNFKIGFSNQFW